MTKKTNKPAFMTTKNTIISTGSLPAEKKATFGLTRRAIVVGDRHAGKTDIVQFKNKIEHLMNVINSGESIKQFVLMSSPDGNSQTRMATLATQLIFDDDFSNVEILSDEFLKK